MIVEIDKTEEMVAFTKEVIVSHKGDKTQIIGMLQEIQEKYHYLPMVVINEISKSLNITPQSVYGVATFYAQFSLEPKGKYIVKVCDGTACHVKNSASIYHAIEKEFKFAPEKKTTVDGLFTLETVACLGACGIAPVMVINETVYPQMDPDAAIGVIKTLVERDTTEQEIKV
jgi:NADH-quinone oxidoreductase subunit E